jgi:hypothetical protein
VLARIVLSQVPKSGPGAPSSRIHSRFNKVNALAVMPKFLWQFCVWRKGAPRELTVQFCVGTDDYLAIMIISDVQIGQRRVH